MPETTAELVLALRCAACRSVSSLEDCRRTRNSCFACGIPFSNWEAIVLDYTMIDQTLTRFFQQRHADEEENPDA